MDLGDLVNRIEAKIKIAEKAKDIMPGLVEYQNGYIRALIETLDDIKELIDENNGEDN